MKLVLVLVALVAASEAAFTGQLSQQARPILNDAIVKMRTFSARSSNFRESALVNGIIDNMQSQADNLMAQIENALNQGHAVAANVVAQFQSTIAQLQALGANVQNGASNVVSNFLQGLNNIFGNLFGNSGNRDLADVIEGIITNFNDQYQMSNILTSNFAQYIAGLINNLGSSSQLVHDAVIGMLGQLLGTEVLNHFSQGRGLFNGPQNIASQISAASQQAFAGLSNALNNLINVATSNFQQLQTLAAQFVQASIGQIQTTLGQAAQEFLNCLKPYQQDLGDLTIKL